MEFWSQWDNCTAATCPFFFNGRLVITTLLLGHDYLEFNTIPVQLLQSLRSPWLLHLHHLLLRKKRMEDIVWFTWKLKILRASKKQS